MFGSNKTTTATPRGKRGSISVLGTEVRVTGNIVAADLHMDGTIDGDVDCGALIIGAGGHVAGSVSADRARIAGTVEGAVSVRDLIVERTARIVGDIAYEAINIETGAQVDGQLRGIKIEAKAPLALEAKTDSPRLLEAEDQAAA